MRPESESIRLDLNNSEFQGQLFRLPKEDQRSVLNTLLKLSQMTWNQLYRDVGLRWESIASQIAPQGGRLYSLRIGKGFRALAHREGSWLRVLSLHPDHDSAYK